MHMQQRGKAVAVLRMVKSPVWLEWEEVPAEDRR